jgi:integrase
MKRGPAGKADFVETVWDDFVARHLDVNAKPSSVARFKRVFTKQIKPKWKNRRIDAIEKRDVLELIDEAGKRGPHAANSIVTVLSSFFNWCLSRDVVKVSPMAGVKKPNVESSRERTLSDNELKTIWKGCGHKDVNPIFAAFVKLLILTGCRRGEVADMRWTELDLANRSWVIPGERTKNGNEHRVYLTDSMVAIIEKIPRIDKCEFVFTNDGESPISGFSKMKLKLDAATPDLAAWTLHDARRTIASGLARLGTPLATVEKLLNHTSGSFSGIVSVYQTYNFAPEMKAAWELWSDHVAAVIAGRKSNVVKLRPEVVA